MIGGDRKPLGTLGTRGGKSSKLGRGGGANSRMGVHLAGLSDSILVPFGAHGGVSGNH